MEIWSPTETTVSTLSRESDQNVQSMVDHYISEIIDHIIDDPHITIPKILQTIAQHGPCPSQKDVIHLFGGKKIFKKTCRRMEIIRWAAATDQLEMLPLADESQSENEIQHKIMHGIRADYLKWWAPSRAWT